jgi:hypothetical protein
VSFKRLHQEGFDAEHQRDEGQSIGEQELHVEELERHVDLEADAATLYRVLAEIGGEKLVGPAKTLDPGVFYKGGAGASR